MEKINKIGILGIFVVMLIGIGTNIAFGDKLYDIHDYVRVADYEIDVTKYVSDNFTIYVENNETIITSGKMENCINGFSECPTKYSGNYNYGESTLGNGEKYYI